MYICINVYMYICIYVYMYICIYVYMYICIYVNMYIHRKTVLFIAAMVRIRNSQALAGKGLSTDGLNRFLKVVGTTSSSLSLNLLGLFDLTKAEDGTISCKYPGGKTGAELKKLFKKKNIIHLPIRWLDDGNDANNHAFSLVYNSNSKR